MLITQAESDIINALDDAVCVFEQLPPGDDGKRDYRYLFVNDAFRQLFDTPDLSGLSIRDNFPQEPESWYDVYDEVLRTGVPQRFTRETLPQGMILEMYVTRVKGGSGKRLMNTMRDVTAGKQLELALRDSESKLKESEANIRNLIMQAPVAMALLTGPEFTVNIINDNFIALWGKDASVRGKPIMDALPEMKDQPYPDILRQVYKTGITYYGNEDKVLLWRNGKLEPGYFNFVNEPYRDSRGKIAGVIVVASEVTQQVLANQALRQALEKVRLAQEAAKVGIFDYDLVNNILEWDERCRELFGIVDDKPITYESDFLNGLHPDDRERLDLVVKDCMIKSKTGGIFDDQYRTINQADGTERWVRAKGQVFFDETDKPVRFIGVVLDITEQKRDDLRKNDFIGMVSHELKTPLTSLSAIIQLATTKLKNTGDQFLPNAMARANVQVKRMTSMINGFLNISRLEAGQMRIEKQWFNLEKLLSEIVQETRLIATSNPILMENCEPTPVYADRDKISSVISNLLSNGVKYSGSGKAVRAHCQIDGKNAVLRVEDDGVGINPDDLQRIFDRYYRVEADHARHISGFGIGLYLSSEIVRLHGGKIWAESVLGKGSIFYFTLPVDPVNS